MAKKKYYDADDFEYSEDEGEEERDGKPMTMFMVILGVLLLALSVLCVLLTLRLRSERKTVDELNVKLTAAENSNAQSSWSYAPTDEGSTPSSTGTETESPLPEATPVPTPTPEPTPEPTPVPTPTPAPAVTTPGGLPSWLTEANMAKITKRPKDDEWYSSPGKLYVTAEIGLNMRGGPDSSYGLITTIPPKTEVTVYASHDNWRFVQDLKGNFGWVSNNMLSNDPPEGVITSASTQTPTPTVEAPVITG